MSITALGMVSALGSNVIASCAAARAGLSAASELTVLSFETDELFGPETLDGPPVIHGHSVRGIADGFTGVGKALLFLSAALRDLLEERPLSREELERTGLCINVSDFFLEDTDAIARRTADAEQWALPSDAWKKQTADLCGKVSHASKLGIGEAHQSLHHGGHGGLAISLRDAMAMIESGKVDRCLVAAVDSRTAPAFLSAAARLQVLRTQDNPVGLAPGEAAAVFLLERARDAPRSARSNAMVTAISSGRDPVGLLGDRPPLGAALAGTLLGAAPKNAEGRATVDFCIGDLNGTERRAQEWGRALAKLAGESSIGDAPCWFPASSFGDTGAAAGAVGVCIAVRALTRGYAPGKTGLVWLSSESGDNGAITIQAQPT